MNEEDKQKQYTTARKIQDDLNEKLQSIQESLVWFSQNPEFNRGSEANLQSELKRRLTEANYFLLKELETIRARQNGFVLNQQGIDRLQSRELILLESRQDLKNLIRLGRN